MFLGAVGGPKGDSFPRVGTRPENGLGSICATELAPFTQSASVRVIEPLRGIYTLKQDRLGDLRT